VHPPIVLQTEAARVLIEEWLAGLIFRLSNPHGGGWLWTFGHLHRSKRRRSTGPAAPESCS